THIERPWRPIQRNTAGSVLCPSLGRLQKGFNTFGKLKVFFVPGLFFTCFTTFPSFLASESRDRSNERVPVECRKVRIISLDVDTRRVVIVVEVHIPRSVVVEVRESNLVLGTYLVTHDELVDVVELVPVLVAFVKVTM